MFRFTYESVFVDKAELRAEIGDLLWHINRTWPITDQAFLKRNGGVQRQTFEVSPIKAQHVEVWRIQLPSRIWVKE